MQYLLRGCLISVLTGFLFSVSSQPFNLVNHPFPAIDSGAVAWADYDADGDMDFALSGHDGMRAVSKLYTQVDGRFVESNSGIIPVWHSVLRWADLDDDNDLDLLVAGYTGSEFVTELYENTPLGFVHKKASLPGIALGTIETFDIDNDGDKDIFLSGWTGKSAYCGFLINHGGLYFSERAWRSAQVYNSSSVWFDADKDRDFDLIVTGQFAEDSLRTYYFNNVEGHFSNHTFVVSASPGVNPKTDRDRGPSRNIRLISLFRGSMSLGDCSSDGDWEILLTGISKVSYYRQHWGKWGSDSIWRDKKGQYQVFPTIYEIRANKFTPMYVRLKGYFRGFYDGQVAWIDYDNDGDDDILFSGIKPPGGHSYEFKLSEPGVYTSADVFEELGCNTFQWADYDNDGDIDLLSAGRSSKGSGKIVTLLHQNAHEGQNTIPTVPTRLRSSFEGSAVILEWEGGSDRETPDKCLTYNLFVKRVGDTTFVMSPESSTKTGMRYLPYHGNVLYQKSWKLRGLASGKYEWRVQSVDRQYAGSQFSAPKFFTVVNSTEPIVARTHHPTTSPSTDILEPAGIAKLPAIEEFIFDMNNEIEARTAERWRWIIIIVGILSTVAVAVVIGLKISHRQKDAGVFTRGGGQRLGRYTLSHRIGAGSMGIVFEAHDEKLERKVALKLLNMRNDIQDLQANKDEVLLALRQEALGTAGLNHPNIVSVYDFDFVSGYYFIVLELLQGQSLADFIADVGRVPTDQAVRLMLEICKALKHAHGRGVFHCDIKPSNIMLKEDEHVKVVDFGIARLLSHLNTQDNAFYHSLSGSPGYMAPEQIDGDSITARTDIFAAGTVFYEMLTGRRPFDLPEGSSFHQLFYRVLNYQLIPLRSQVPDVSPQLESIINKMMSRQHEMRYNSVSEVIRELAEYQAE